MKKRGKKYLKKVKLVDSTKTYSLEEAVELLKKTSPVKFDASVEVHLWLGIDTSSGEQQVRSSVVLPHGTGKDKKVAVFAQGEALKQAEEAGADRVGGKEIIDEIKAQKRFEGIDVVVATPQMMPLLAPVAKILGPRGLMPSLKTETVTDKVGEAVRQLKKGKIEFRNDTGGNLHQLVGKVSWESPRLIENVKTLLEAVRKAKPAKSKGTFLRQAVLCSTMGPGIKIQI
jgi:large subunit ribosomal protein L1